MKEPNLQTTAILSLIIHIAFFSIALIITKQTGRFVIPSSYTVSLVVADAVRSDVSGDATSMSSASSMSLPYDNVSKDLKSPDDARQYASDRIAAIEATRKAKNIVRLRNIISLRGSGTSENTTAVASHPGGKAESYPEKIGMEIKRQWAYPDTGGMDLEAIISITVLHDGVLKINRIEKSSGNVLFDRSVLHAINKASPVSPPPYEMEIGVRFKP